MISETQAAYVAFIERELKRTKQQLKEHIASELVKDEFIERVLNDKCS